MNFLSKNKKRAQNISFNLHNIVLVYSYYEHE